MHFEESQLPFCAVESSHAWKPTVYLPAFQPCWPSMYAIALFISVVSARFAPWSGRSDAMMNCGLPLPLYWSLPQDDDGNTVTPAFLLAPPMAVATTTSAAMLATSAPIGIPFFT